MNVNFDKLLTFNTEKYGDGVKAIADIDKDSYICEYKGKIITNDEMEKTYKTNSYLLELVKDYKYIDSSVMGGIASKLNHACKPNCQAIKMKINTETIIVLKSIKKIKKEAELTWDYNLDNLFCLCGKGCKYKNGIRKIK